MNRSLFFSLFLVAYLAGCGEGSETASRSVTSPEESFAPLDPYGAWMDVAGLGLVWQPAVTYDWAPFADGQWVWTDRGWMWSSDEPFGWIVYHYGYWTHWGAAGWLWVPAYEWSPARVQWYAGRDFIGWAPLPPPMLSSQQMYEQARWVVVPENQFTREHVGRYRTAAEYRSLAPKREEQRAPDIESVRRATKQEMKRWRTESEDVRRGERILIRVRTREEAQPAPAPPPAQVTPPPSVAQPSPGTGEGKVRQSGQTRAPGTTRATPAPRKTERTAPPAKAAPRSTQRPATRDSVRAGPQRPDASGARTPVRKDPR
jgi:hypothetical protein